MYNCCKCGRKGITYDEDVLRENCHDCGAKVGRCHKAGCDVERCSVCKGQRLGCDCKGHSRKASKWTGFWPGTKEAAAKKICLNCLTIDEMTGAQS